MQYKRRYFILAFLLIACSCVNAQNTTSSSQITLDSINRNIDKAVVEKNKPYLLNAYSDDFIFTHGTGHIDSKKSWIDNVVSPKTNFISRVHDSIVVEIHNNTGIIYGKLTIQRKDADGIKDYVIKYVRVFNKEKNHWQMVSHRTVWESDL